MPNTLTPWYLTARPLALLATLREKPPVEWQRKRYVITTDEWGEFRGEAFDQLTKLHKAEAQRRKGDVDAWSEACCVTPTDVIGALFGDPNGNEHWRTHRDTSDEWDAIRRNVGAALQRRAA